MAFLRRPARPEPEPKPVVMVPSGGITVTMSAESLFRAIGPKHQLFHRGGAVVQLTQEDGRLIIKAVDPASATSLFEKHVEFRQQRRVSTTVVHEATVINETTAKIYLKAEACQTLLPALNGVVNCPLLVERNGELHQVNSGYDPATKLYVANTVTVPVIAVEEAVENLNSLLIDFRFKTEADRSRALASFLTPALKFGGFITGPVPVEVAEANLSQSGKSYRQQLVAAVYRERMAVVTKKAHGVGGMEETFQKHLLDGCGFIQFDNVRGKLDSQLVEAFMTSRGGFPVRIAFHPEVAVDPSKHVLFISSNGFESTKDLANRSLIVRIIKREGCNFPLHDGLDLVEFVFNNHVRFLASVYAVIRHWHRAGKPRTAETRHDFKEWCQVCDWIISNVFDAAALMDGHEEAKLRVSNPNLTFFRNLAVKLEDAERLGEGLTASNIAEFCADEDVELPNLGEKGRDDAQTRRTHVGRIMKAILDGADQRNWEGYRVVRVETVVGDCNGDGRGRYRITKVEVG